MALCCRPLGDHVLFGMPRRSALPIAA
jgi:hypothetical protein